MESIWCASNRMTAFNDAVAGKAVKPATCDINLKSQYELGTLFGLQGTPAVIVDGTTVVAGYSAPSDLKSTLDAYTAHKKSLALK